MTPVERIADAFRTVALRLEDALERGRPNGTISAEDVRQTLLSISDDLDPPVLNTVEPESACPNCGERNADRLVWQDEDTVLCAVCNRQTIVEVIVEVPIRKHRLEFSI